MKRLGAACTLALALSGQAAFAEKEKEHPWTGFNVGLDVGYAWDPTISTAAFPVTADIDRFLLSEFSDVGPYPGLTPGQASALSATGVVRPNVGGAIGGGQIGYNYQYGDSIVAGIEADFQGATVRGRQGFTGAATTTILNFSSSPCFTGCPDPVTSFVENEKSIDWLGTVRARFGYLATPTLLVYATGGLAYGRVAAGTSIFQTWGPSAAGPGPFLSPGAVGHFSDTRPGWTVGGGLEWLFLPNWSAKVEYLHYDLGSVQFASSPLLTISPAGAVFAGAPSASASDIAIPITSTRFYGDTVRAGVSYHFNLF